MDLAILLSSPVSTVVTLEPHLCDYRSSLWSLSQLHFGLVNLSQVCPLVANENCVYVEPSGLWLWERALEVICPSVPKSACPSESPGPSSVLLTRACSRKAQE
jgi:hypothetical protein